MGTVVADDLNETQESFPFDYSVILPCFNEEATVESFFYELKKALETVPRRFEIIFINDGSTDRTPAIMERLYNAEPLVGAVVNLLKNYGQTAAQTAGINYARGRHFLFVDADMQIDPRDVARLVEAFEGGYDVAGGRRIRRQDPWYRRIASKILNTTFSRVTDGRLQDLGCGLKIIEGRLMRSFHFGPYKLVRPITIFAHAGRFIEIPIEHHARASGKSRWSFLHLWRFYRNIILETSQFIFQILGASCMVLTAAALLAVLLEALLPYTWPEHVWTRIILVVILLNLLLMVGFLTLLGEFLLRTFREVQGDPVYHIYSVKQKPVLGDPPTGATTAAESRA